MQCVVVNHTEGEYVQARSLALENRLHSLRLLAMELGDDVAVCVHSQRNL